MLSSPMNQVRRFDPLTLTTSYILPEPDDGRYSCGAPVP